MAIEEHIINDQYEIRQRLMGGMAIVYIVLDQVSQKIYALKTLRDELVERGDNCVRFEREARTWMNLEAHENIVRAVSFYRAEQPLLLLEYIEGPSLKDLIRVEPLGLALPEAVNLGIQILKGLAFAHTHPMPGNRHGIIHRDIKPGNVLITRGHRAKLTDFGLARARDDRLLTDSLGPMGTPLYMPPEQFEDAHAVSEKADLYAFGMTMYEMITGRRPFQMGTFQEVKQQVFTHDPEPITMYCQDANPELVELVEHCLQKEPNRRPSSSEELLERLEAIQTRLASEVGFCPACQVCGYIPKKEHTRCPVCRTGKAETESPVLDEPRRCTCGHSVPSFYRFCIMCGRELEAGTCTCVTCGETNPSDYRYCYQCGTELIGDWNHQGR